MKKLLIFLFLLITSCSSLEGKSGEVDITSVRDSLDRITLPSPIYHQYEADLTLHICSQEEWDNIAKTVKNLLSKGKQNINVEVDAESLVYGKHIQVLSNLDYPKANVRIHANHTKMIPTGPTFKSVNSISDDFFYASEYSDYNGFDVLFDEEGKPLTLYEPVFMIDNPIEEVPSSGTEEILNRDGTLYKKVSKVWRFKTNLPDLNENKCRDFQILLTHNWTTMIHQVIKVERGYLYFNLRPNKKTTFRKRTADPNVDMKYYHAYPRCRYLNSPVSKGVHVISNKILIPKNIPSVTIGKGARLFTVRNTKLKSLEISGFDVIGAGNSACISVSRSRFINQMWIRENSFSNLSSSAVSITDSENVCVYNNSIKDTRVNALTCNGKNISVSGNHLKDIGFMSQTTAIRFSGKDIHVYDNIIEDFYYSAIGCGSRKSTKSLTYIIERNLIRHTPTFIAHYKERTVADGGGIYIGPQNTSGIIRYNVVQNIIGIGSNRGIFLDDGAKNLSIYGNLITGTANSYDIDLRYCATYKKEIPDHNTNNIIIQNVMTGAYRFEESATHPTCIAGGNVFLGLGNKTKKNKVSIVRRTADTNSVKGITLDSFVKKYMQ